MRVVLTAEMFGARVALSRNERGLRQVDVAKRVGVSVALIAHLEKGERTVGAWDVGRLERLADVVGIERQVLIEHAFALRLAGLVEPPYAMVMARAWWGTK